MKQDKPLWAVFLALALSTAITEKEVVWLFLAGGALAGAISIFEQQDPDHYRESARVNTVKGTRTSFFSPELDRLFVAVRRRESQPAAIWVFAPAH